MKRNMGISKNTTDTFSMNRAGRQACRSGRDESNIKQVFRDAHIIIGALLLFVFSIAHSQPRIVYGENLIYVVNDSISKVNRLGTYNGNTSAVFANPDSGHGCEGSMIVFGNKLYYCYADKDSDFVLAAFDGSKSCIIPMQDKVQYGGMPFVYGNSLLGRLYFKSADSGSVSLGDTAVAYGYQGSPIVFNNKLYFHYSDGKDKLAEYDGVNTRVFANPDTGGFGGNPLVHNGNLYFKYVDAYKRGHIATLSGDSIRLFDNPDNGSVSGTMTVFNNSIYCLYSTAYNFNKLGLFSADSITLFPNPDPGPGLYGGLFTMGSNLYFVYYDTLAVKQIGKFDGSSITLFPRPDNGVGFKGDVCIFNNSFYFMYTDAATKQRLAKCDGNTVSLLINPDAGLGYQGYNVIYNNSLYFMYASESGRSYMAKTEGSDITLLPVYLGGKLSKKGHYTPPPFQNADIGPYTQSLSNIVEMKTSVIKSTDLTGSFVFPNPASSFVTIHCPQLPADISIIDISGNVIISSKASSTETVLNISSLREGIYLLSIRSYSGSFNVKLVKQ